MKITETHILLALIIISAATVTASIYYRYKQYDPAKSGLLVYNWTVGELPLGFTHFGYQPDSMIYLDIVQRMYKYGTIGYWLDSRISAFQNLRYYAVVILCRPLSHVGNLIMYGIWRDPNALMVLPLLGGVFGAAVMYLILRELNLSIFRSTIGALLLLVNKYFLFEAGEALFDTPAMVIGMIALYVWIRSKWTGNDKWVALALTAALLYRQSNVIIFVACFAYEYLNHNLKKSNWWKLPLAATLLLAPLYLYHAIGGWTFFTPGLIRVEYHGSILNKPMYFMRTFEIAFGGLGILAVISLVKFFWDNKLKFTKVESIIPIYLIAIWVFNFFWAINMGRFWMIASPPVIYLVLILMPDWVSVFLLFILVNRFDYSYSIIAEFATRIFQCCG